MNDAFLRAIADGSYWVSGARVGSYDTDEATTPAGLAAEVLRLRGLVADATWHEGALQRQAARAVEAERQRDEAQQSLRERTAEREALCERVSVLEETLAKVRSDDMAPTLRKAADALVALMNLRALLVEVGFYNVGGDATDVQRRVSAAIILSACGFDLPRQLRALAEPADGPALVREVSGGGAGDTLWRPGETAAECWARHQREAEARGRHDAEERLRLSVAAWDAAGMQGRDAVSVIHEAQEQGARWAIEAWWRRGFTMAVGASAGREEEAARICAEARKAGEHG